MAAANSVKTLLEARSPYSLKAVDARYLQLHANEVVAILDGEEARTSRLDVHAFTTYIDQLAAESWQENTNMACCVVRKNDALEIPLAIAIASKKEYRAGARRIVELNWEKTQQYRGLAEQWCVEYVVRSRDARGAGLGCFAMAGLLEEFEARFEGDGMLWLLLAGGFPNISALSVYTTFGFLVTSLDSGKTPIMSLQVRGADIRERVTRVVANTLTLRHGAAAADGAADADGAGADDGNMPAAHVAYNLRRRRARRRRVLRQGGAGGRQQRRRQPRAERTLTFRTIKEQFALLSGPLVLPPQLEGLEHEMMEQLWLMSERASLVDPSSQSFLIHLNVAKQCHHIASRRRLHVSR